MNKLAAVCLALMLVGTIAFAEDAAAKKVLLPMHIPFQEAWFVDSTGNIADAAGYLDASRYSEGLAAVHVPGKGWGFVDAAGRFAIQPQFSDVHLFREGRAAFQQKGSELWGYIDAGGNVVVPARYKLAYSFNEGIAHVWTGEESQLIDKTGRALAIPAPWKVLGLEGFSEGLAPVCTEGTTPQVGFVDASGKIALVLTGCSEAREFHEGLAAVKIGSKFGYADRKGKIVIPAVYDMAHGFHEKRAAVQIGKKWGFIDPQGNMVVAAEWDGCDDYSEGLAAVSTGGTELFQVGSWRYIDANGKTVITAAYSYAGAFQDGFAEVGIGEDLMQRTFFFIDAQGRPLSHLAGFLVDAKTDFSSESNAFGFRSSDLWKVDKGVCTYVSKGGRASWRYGADLVPSDFSAAVTVVSMAGNNPSAGIVFRVNKDEESFYWFGIGKDGSCSASFRTKPGADGKEWQSLGIGSAKAKPGANVLQVVCRGDTVSCFLNGTKSLTFQDSWIGESYRRVGLLASDATSASFDDLAVRAIGRDEAVAGLDLEPTLADFIARLDTQLSAFPDLGLRLFVPPQPLFAGELFLSFEGLEDGAYRLRQAEQIELSFDGQPRFKDLGKYIIQFPAVMPKLDAGARIGVDAPDAYSPRIYHPLLSLYGGLSAADLEAAAKASPKAAGAMDLAVFLNDWKALSAGWLTIEQGILTKNRWVLGEDPFGYLMNVVAFGGLAAIAVGLVDWGISGTFGERQSWEVWGGLGAFGSYYVVYMPIGYFIIKPIYDNIAKGKIAEEKRKYDEKFRARAAALREKYPGDVIEGRPNGTKAK
jgi:hypothetical protein